MKRYRQKNSQWPVYEVVSDSGIEVTLKVVESLAGREGQELKVSKAELRERYVEVPDERD